MIDNKFLKITDRKKEIFKTSGGKYIAPQPVENKLKECNLLEQVMVVGENHNFPAVLMIPNFAALKKWCEVKGIQYSTDEQMVKDPQVLDKFQKELDSINK